MQDKVEHDKAPGTDPLPYKAGDWPKDAVGGVHGKVRSMALN